MRKAMTARRLAPLLFLLLASCVQVPLTGRSQLRLVSDAELSAMAATEYDRFLQEHPLSADTAAATVVKRVGFRIRRAVNEFAARQQAAGNRDLAEQLAGYQWEFNLVASDDVNAWAMPGGKVVVYEGILPIARDETGLAVVMGHEIAHVVANHGNERMSHEMLAQFGVTALSEALASQPAATRDLYTTVFGVGASLGYLMPYSRLQESEADRLGLIFMAMAGYDPHAAVGFWQRMAEEGGRSVPEFLSTHPADDTRIKDIRCLVATEAMRYYRPQ